MPAPVIRIFSDLHYRDGASELRHLDALHPLFEGADRIVLNGDTLDTQTAASPPLVAEAREFFARQTPSVTFVSGNHDPDISPHHDYTLHNERVWLTHGDVLFDDIAPWSALREEIRNRLVNLARNAPPDALRRLESRLHLHRLACHNLPELHNRLDRRLVTRLRRLAEIAVNPGRVWRMFNAWHTTPSRARHWARAHRPNARLVLVGHTHRPGVWRGRCGVVVVNTGSFCRPFGGLCVELRDDHVQVIRIEQHRDTFRRGSVVSRFSLAH